MKATNWMRSAVFGGNRHWRSGGRGLLPHQGRVVAGAAGIRAEAADTPWVFPTDIFRSGRKSPPGGAVARELGRSVADGCQWRSKTVLPGLSTPDARTRTLIFVQGRKILIRKRSLTPWRFPRQRRHRGCLDFFDGTVPLRATVATWGSVLSDDQLQRLILRLYPHRGTRGTGGSRGGAS